MKTYTRVATAFALAVTLAHPVAGLPKDVGRERPFQRLVRVIKKLIGTGDVMSPPNPVPNPSNP